MLGEEHTRLCSDGEFATFKNQALSLLLAAPEERSKSLNFADEQGLWVAVLIEEIACLAFERGDGDAVVIDDAFLADGDFDGGHGLPSVE